MKSSELKNSLLNDKWAKTNIKENRDFQNGMKISRQYIQTYEAQF